MWNSFEMCLFDNQSQSKLCEVLYLSLRIVVFWDKSRSFQICILRLVFVFSFFFSFFFFFFLFSFFFFFFLTPSISNPTNNGSKQKPYNQTVYKHLSSPNQFLKVSILELVTYNSNPFLFCISACVKKREEKREKDEQKEEKGRIYHPIIKKQRPVYPKKKAYFFLLLLFYCIFGVVINYCLLNLRQKIKQDIQNQKKRALTD